MAQKLGANGLSNGVGVIPFVGTAIFCWFLGLVLGTFLKSWWYFFLAKYGWVS